MDESSLRDINLRPACSTVAVRTFELDPGVAQASLARVESGRRKHPFAMLATVERDIRGIVVVPFKHRERVWYLDHARAGLVR